MAASPRTVRITWERPPHHCNSLLEWRPRVVRVNFDFAFNANVSWTNLVQWDNKSELLGWSSRATWIMEPGNELVLAFDPFFKRRDRLEFDSTETQVAVKVLWTFRF